MFFYETDRYALERIKKEIEYLDRDMSYIKTVLHMLHSSLRRIEDHLGTAKFLPEVSSAPVGPEMNTYLTSAGAATLVPEEYTNFIAKDAAYRAAAKELFP